MKFTPSNRKPLYAALVGGAVAMSAVSGPAFGDTLNPPAAARALLLAASCNPCAVKKPACGACNPCAVKKVSCGACNPCAVKKATCGACNPCAAKKAPCGACNPCAVKKKTN